MSYHGIRNTGFLALTGALPRCGLQSLTLRYNRIDARGVLAFTQNLLHAPTGSEADNGSSDPDTHEAWPRAVRLDLRNNSVNEETRRALKNSVQCAPITESDFVELPARFEAPKLVKSEEALQGEGKSSSCLGTLHSTHPRLPMFQSSSSSPALALPPPIQASRPPGQSHSPGPFVYMYLSALSPEQPSWNKPDPIVTQLLNPKQRSVSLTQNPPTQTLPRRQPRREQKHHVGSTVPHRPRHPKAAVKLGHDQPSKYYSRREPGQEKEKEARTKVPQDRMISSIDHDEKMAGLDSTDRILIPRTGIRVRRAPRN